MATMTLLDDADLSPAAAEVFADIRATRGTDYVNNFWRALANDPALLRATWDRLKDVMAPGALDPLTKEMIYIAVSAANACTYCAHSHTASARARGMTEAQYAELLSVIGMAMQTNGLVSAMQVPVDPAFDASSA
ncbi:carboxymuconolactone decarboxylase family protein [Ponticoccus sp. SC2-23]|uniref:carboxymuconolactone decarboxylase family protein n=1 Tax=Alexandriicola marinus TaxID=2081710 RepID=UPI000FD85A97|nr:carboxymuconolactone decarboxylase family protein [Alexandriicola marinus]MBM1219951.1 carboxymuconolactone decarboxylase family protein [Ponticoccus sp. SC6-9]MBM1224637.1 carboxymuconolactone decarboxylase family protein [Ponticoccus sp. SC6-15]MBM1228150.1 carboxymuconolactone decarboxylase family protein [Ponticoccus sp. SC6-38]MBM1234212.1 carboxymuconolactone decarboxylase family protein [Ponticoccus sp. SC6-45]MBM1238652.1 carboxymuconolactone decarboxylase family protein [Ponticoccu